MFYIHIYIYIYTHTHTHTHIWASPVAQQHRIHLHAGDTGDMGLIPGSGRSPGEGNGNPL